MGDKLKIACILDEFSYTCFQYDCTLIPLEPGNWAETMARETPDFLLVESAWNGNGGAWVKKIENLQLKTDDTLKCLVDWCRSNKIPTVFWNKEDPIHFDIFLTAASYFDYVFTTDADSVAKYREKLNHERVYVLPFAAQPRIHNPVDRDREKLGSVAFSGSWYNHHPVRVREMERMLKPAFDYGLHIYDRNPNTANNNFIYPAVYRPYIKGSVPYAKMCEIYKKYPVFLNVNIVQDSPTMFSRRVFELLACGTPVISSPSLGIENLFGGIVKIPKGDSGPSESLNLLINDPEENRRLSVQGTRAVLAKHTYRHRLNEIAGKLGLKYKAEEPPGVSIITSTIRQHCMQNVLDNYNRQRYPNKELLVILNRNSMDMDKWRECAEKYEHVRVFRMDESKGLGECLNYAIENAEFDYVSKFDDDNYYGPDFTGDLMNAFTYTDADIVGKQAYFIYFEGSNTLAIYGAGFENRYVSFMSGSALIVKKSVFDKIKFIDGSKSEDTQFLKDCVASGLKLYSTDRYNYACIRKASKSEHTWKAEDADLLKSCRFIAHTEDYKKLVTI